MVADSKYFLQLHLKNDPARIVSVGLAGLLSISFDDIMKVPENATRIGNKTVLINGTNYPILEITVIAGAFSEMKLLKFNWTFLNFSPTLMQLQLSFENPLLVSSNSAYPDKIKVKFHGC